MATNCCKEGRCHIGHRGTRCAQLEAPHPATALCFLLSYCRFLKSKSLEKPYWRLYRPTTGAFLLLTALHLCDQVKGTVILAHSTVWKWGQDNRAEQEWLQSCLPSALRVYGFLSAVEEQVEDKRNSPKIVHIEVVKPAVA